MRKPPTVDELYRLRHSTAHVMAQAVKHLFPETKIAIGPPTEDGFYYDFDRDTPFTPEDLAAIEEEMKKSIAADDPFVCREIGREEAIRFFEERNEPYKVELIHDIPEGEPITLYQNGDFIDLCRGPHVARTGEIKAFKLLHVAGAYWRGDERNKMLQRIYGTAFFSQAELEEHLHRLEEARRRDHRRLGRELGIFLIAPEVGAGLPIWLPKGAIVRETLVEFMREEQRRRGYLPVITPPLAKVDLYKLSGHWYTYRDKMFPAMQADHEEFVLKPMNCPFHIQVYRSELRSYRDLPIRLAEFGTVYRYEQSGELGGLTRVRGFTQDDAHLFCRPDQLLDEFRGVVDLVILVLRRLGLPFRARVGVRDTDSEKYVGTPEQWEQAQQAILAAVQSLAMPHFVAEGEAAFYGPKLDFLVEDALGREWQLGTIQVDYVLPERFDLTYMGDDGQQHRPVMIHRAPFGSLERFIGILIEHYAGAFPLWLAPVQVRLIPIADRHVDYCRAVCIRLQEAGLRAEVDERNEKIGYKIRQAQLEKIPYMLVVGDREVESGQVAVRSREAGDRGAVPVEAFLDQVRAEVWGGTPCH